MAHTGIFATSSEILTCAGENYDTSVTEAKINELCLQAESYINSVCMFNFSDNFVSLNVDVKYLLSCFEANFVAFHIIKYNMAGYSSRIEAETMLDGCWATYHEIVTILKDKEIQTYMDEA